MDATSLYVLDLDGLWRVEKATGKRGDLPIDATVNNVTVGGTEVLRATLAARPDWEGQVITDRRHALMLSEPHEYLEHVHEWLAGHVRAA